MYLGSGGSEASHFGYSSDPSLNSGLSLQEMIDSDIKADFDDVMQSNPSSFQGKIFATLFRIFHMPTAH